jgi:hypothetical protein
MLHERNQWDPAAGRTERRTEAGFGPQFKRSALSSLRSRAPVFIRKNKGLFGNTDFWRLLPRLLRSRRSASLYPEYGRCRFVATHHKAMTTYFTAVLRPLAFATCSKFENLTFSPPHPKTDIFLSAHGKIDLKNLGTYRGIHVMRDPRDMIVSGYHYHKWTHEIWVHRPDEHGWTYQQKLNSVDKATGLFMEIDHFVFMYRELLEGWDMENPDILEVRFDEISGNNREKVYCDMFEFLEYDGEQLDIAIDLMRLFEAKRRTGRLLAAADAKNEHIRSGRSEQWREELGQEHLAYIEAQLGPVLRKFGYPPHYDALSEAGET